mmetsp:Transcript_44379/g.107349  ORF Transcript_44379/g.107349 Transcript_44379/m.107349 type:complete len:281 (+) Transcript_44379:200-1042(+)|eukprot:CAMPEP_0113500990 /NCGR_PEP_ID=MMETSP0014_2-20120614/32677_1 /TAXON_ID=2857 /ORGANISM="Nitzschia sp." /LENGTH=280 /DNA_ID=CAMNT_0000395471 /DNA_START=103 /DNA_END=945 /DNA_ORIENTATION=+ /assembly_acc=CAM_ASM_000159
MKVLLAIIINTAAAVATLVASTMLVGDSIMVSTAMMLLPTHPHRHHHGNHNNELSALHAASQDHHEGRGDVNGSSSNTGTSALYDPPPTTEIVTESSSSAPAPAAPTPPSSSTQATTMNDRKPPTTTAKLVQNLASLDEFVDCIENAPPDKLVVVKFYGRSCPLCKRTKPRYQKMAKFYSKAPTIIQFVEIEKTVHPQLFDTLEVTTFPFIQMYRNNQCIASHGTVSSEMFDDVCKDTIQQFLGLSKGQWNTFLETFEEPIRKATQNYESIRKIRDGDVI